MRQQLTNCSLFNSPEKGVSPGVNSTKTTEPEHVPNVKLVLKTFSWDLCQTAITMSADQIKDPRSCPLGGVQLTNNHEVK